MIFKNTIILGRLVVVETILGFRSEVLVMLIKCSLKILDGPLLSENIHSFSEMIILSKKLSLSEKYGLEVRQKFLLFCSIQVLGLP